MPQSKFARLAMLLFMAAVLVYTIVNYFNGKSNILTLGIAVFLAVTSGSALLRSLLDDFKK